MTDKPKGTGLGLPISRQIVEFFGGRLWVESQPSIGANFIFTVPLLVSDEQKGNELNDKKILIVDDEPNIVISPSF